MKKTKSILTTDLTCNHDKKDYGMTMHNYHYHSGYEIYLLIHGTRTLVLNDKIHRTTSYDVAMISCEVFHRSYGDTPYEGICINFPKNYLDRYYALDSCNNLLLSFQSPVISLDEEAFQDFLYNSKKLMQTSQNPYVHLGAILDCLLSQTEKSSVIEDDCVSNIKPITDYISNHFLELHSLDELSGALFLTKNYLCNKFKSETGMTITNYIHSLKVQHACMLLTESRDSIVTISKACGFETASYFNKIFKRCMTITPQEFRNQYTYKPEG